MKIIYQILGLFFFSSTLFGQDATVIYNKTVNSTVTIETDIGLGSGFFVGDNIIVTNYHVVNGAAVVLCYDNISSTKYIIDGYIAVDKILDIILLKVSGLNRTAIKMSINPVSPGQRIYALGSPKGLPATISDGLVSGLRDFEGHKLIQITAPISPGSSGGPVLNSKGEVIGVSMGQLKDGQNLNFAIPIDNVQYLMTHILTVQPIGSYKSVIISKQVWMGENLNVSKFRNGDVITEAETDEEWVKAGKAGTPIWCYYNFDPHKGLIYGKLYNWYAVNDSRGLAPEGWHIPSNIEFNELNLLAELIFKKLGQKML